MKIIKKIALFFLICISCKSTSYDSNLSTSKIEKQLLKIHKAKANPIIDGMANEAVWKSSTWYPINQLWLGEPYSKDDFSGRYKLAWTKDALYLLAEIKDDKIYDNHKDPLLNWWDDDCLEIFIDENNSGGEHQYNHNAFAYHIALDGNVVDMSTSQKGKLYNSHITSERITKNNTTIWEVKILLFDDTYNDNGENKPVRLKTNKKIGFALAYCDNDESQHRENFIGSIVVDGGNKNRGWIDANIFGTLKLVNE